MIIHPDRRVSLLERANPSTLEFSAVRYTTVYESGREPYGRYDSTNYAITVWEREFMVYSFVITRSRVAEGMFPVVPDLKQLRRSVQLMFEAGFGEWVKGGLENTLRSLSYSPHVTPSRVRALQKLIDSLPPPPSGWMLPPRPGAAWRRVPLSRTS